MGIDKQGFVSALLDSHGAVSYTHLDVYKRQEPAGKSLRTFAARPRDGRQRRRLLRRSDAAFCRDSVSYTHLVGIFQAEIQNFALRHGKIPERLTLRDVYKRQLLAQAIVHEGLKNVSAGANPMVMRKGMEKAVETAVETIKANSEAVKGSDCLLYTSKRSSGRKCR